MDRLPLARTLQSIEAYFINLADPSVVPAPKLKINDMNRQTAGGLFDCED